MPNAQGIIFLIGMFDLVETDDIVERMSSIFRDDLNFAVYREKIVTSTDLACLVKAASEYIEYPKSYCFVAFYYAGYGGVDSFGYEYLLPMKLTGGNDADDVLNIENNIISPFRSSSLQNCKFLFFFDCCLITDSNKDDQLTRVKKEFDLKAPSAGLVACATSIGNNFSSDKINVGLWTQYLSKRITQARSLSTILGGAREDFVKHVGEDEYMFPKPRYGTDIGEVYLTGIEDCFQISSGVLSIVFLYNKELPEYHSGVTKNRKWTYSFIQSYCPAVISASLFFYVVQPLFYLTSVVE